MIGKVSLADFVAETLLSISEGVRRAQDRSKETDGIPIAPNSVDGRPLDHGDQLVKFVVTVEAGNASAKKGSGEIGGTFLSIVTGKIGAEVSAEKKNASHQMIEFSVPMHFQQRWASQARSEEGNN